MEDLTIKSPELATLHDFHCQNSSYTQIANLKETLSVKTVNFHFKSKISQLSAVLDLVFLSQKQKPRTCHYNCLKVVRVLSYQFNPIRMSKLGQFLQFQSDFYIDGHLEPQVTPQITPYCSPSLFSDMSWQ
jgi:hypothetical protein